MEAELNGTVEVTNERGIHTRMATTLVSLAKTFSSEIELSTDRTTADAKSVMALLTLAAKKGTQLKLRVKGSDQDEAFAKIRELIQNGFPGVED
jgi:phosphocarrier protein HPr